MLEKLEYQIKELKSSERYMVHITIFIIFCFIFYNYIYQDFKNDINFALLQKATIIKKTSNIEKLIQSKPLEIIKNENIQRAQKIEKLKLKIATTKNKLNKIENHNLSIIKDKYQYTMDANKTVLTIEDTLPNILRVADEINQNYKIDYFLLKAKKDGSMTASITTEERILNISRIQELLKLESPFFNINNIIKITSIIGNMARVNGKWYGREDNITSNLKITNITLDGILIKDSKGKLQKFFFNK